MRRLLCLCLLVVIAYSGCRTPEAKPEMNDSVLPAASIAMQSVDKPNGDKETPTVAEPMGVITLADALAYALIHNPELAAYSYDVRAAEARQLQARLLPNPKLDMQMMEFGGSGTKRDFDDAESTIRISQLVELGGKRQRRMELAALDNRISQWEYEAKRLDVIAAVTKAYVDVLHAQEESVLAEELTKLTQALYDTVAQRVDAGKDSPLEKTKAEVNLAKIHLEQNKRQQQLETARLVLSNLWGSQTPKYDKVKGDFTTISSLPEFHDLLQHLDRNPELMRYQVEIQKQQANLKLQEAKAIPDPTLGGGVKYFYGPDETAFMVGFAVPLPLFDRRQGAIQEAKYNYAKSQKVNQAIQNRIYTLLSASYNQLVQTHSEVTAQKEKILPAAQLSFQSAGEGYRQGKFDYLEVLDAQRTYFAAQHEYLQSLAAYHKAVIDIERLTGTHMADREEQKQN